VARAVLAAPFSGRAGAGGADARGSGLAGLAQRIRTVDGELEISSPPRGPTPVRVDLMAQGWSSAGTGEVLVLSTGAVEKHVASIFGNLGLPPSEHDNRRVLAVLRYLTRRAAAGGRPPRGRTAG